MAAGRVRLRRRRRRNRDRRLRERPGRGSRVRPDRGPRGAGRDPVNHQLRGVASPFTRRAWRRSCCSSTGETLQLAHVADRILPNTGLPSDRRRSRGVPGRDRGSLHPAVRWPRPWVNWGRGARAAIDAGATLLAAGLHPDARLFDVELVRSERYERVERQMQGLIKRTPECALHVHVGRSGHRRRGGGDERHPRAAAAAPRAGRQLAVLVRRRLRHGQLARGGDPGVSGPRDPAGAALVGPVPRLPRRRARGRRAHGPHDGVVGRAAAAAARHGRAARDRRADGPRVGGGDRRARRARS